jgi:hypothetical protein
MTLKTAIQKQRKTTAKRRTTSGGPKTRDLSLWRKRERGHDGPLQIYKPTRRSTNSKHKRHEENTTEAQSNQTERFQSSRRGLGCGSVEQGLPHMCQALGSSKSSQRKRLIMKTGIKASKRHVRSHVSQRQPGDLFQALK